LKGINRSDENSDTDSDGEWKLEYELEELEAVEIVDPLPKNEDHREDLDDPAFKLNLQQTLRANEMIL